jgi:hypothetical protein
VIDGELDHEAGHSLDLWLSTCPKAKEGDREAVLWLRDFPDFAIVSLF